MSQIQDSRWTQMLGKKRPTKDVLKFIEEMMLNEIEFKDQYVFEQYNTKSIKYNGVSIAGIFSKNGTQEIKPWGNFARYCSSEFWTNLSDKLGFSHRTGLTPIVKEKKEPTKKDTSLSTEGPLKVEKSDSSNNKSNRNSADYSELMVVRDLCQLHGVLFKSEEDLKNVTEKMMGRSDSNSRKGTQDRNIPQMVEGCQHAINQDKNSGKVVEVRWTGRDSEGTEDLVVTTVVGDIRISLKSIEKSGSGTLKNSGVSSFTDLGLDLSVESEKIKRSVIDSVMIKFPEFNISDSITQSQVKQLARQHPKVGIEAAAASAEGLESINLTIYNFLKNLPQDKMRIHLNQNILDNKEILSNLWVCVANADGYKSWDQKNHYQINADDLITLEEPTPKGFKIFKNGKRFIRANTCCTNGKGISPLCLRYFYDDSSGTEG